MKLSKPKPLFLDHEDVRLDAPQVLRDLADAIEQDAIDAAKEQRKQPKILCWSLVMVDENAHMIAEFGGGAPILMNAALNQAVVENTLSYGAIEEELEETEVEESVSVEG